MQRASQFPFVLCLLPQRPPQAGPLLPSLHSTYSRPAELAAGILIDIGRDQSFGNFNPTNLHPRDERPLYYTTSTTAFTHCQQTNNRSASRVSDTFDTVNTTSISSTSATTTSAMAVPTDQPPVNPMSATSNSSRPTTAEKANLSAPVEPSQTPSRSPSFVQPRKSVSNSQQDTLRLSTGDNGVASLDFQGSVDSNNDLPSLATIKKIENYHVLDRDGKSHTFRSLYTGKHVARRVLIIFVRHFFCGVSSGTWTPPGPLLGSMANIS